jgi:hypothetical protein
MRFYIERNGRPYNYLDDRNKLNNERQAHLQNEETADKDTKKRAKDEVDDKKNQH